MGFAFVDDTDLLQIQTYSTEILEDIVNELQGSLDVWHGTLLASGEALDCDDPNKSCCYGIKYDGAQMAN